MSAPAKVDSTRVRDGLGRRSLAARLGVLLSELAVNADIHDIDVSFVEDADRAACPLGAKGIGELSGVGTAAAIANSVFHATGRRIRDLPIRIHDLL